MQDKETASKILLLSRPLGIALASLLTLSMAVTLTPTSLGQSSGSQTPSENPITSADWGQAPSSHRVMVKLNTTITDSLLDQLRQYGPIHGWIDRYGVVAMTPTGNNTDVIQALPFVESIQQDELRHPTDAGNWALDMIDVTDVEESGVIGDPDLREVVQTGVGVHVAVIDTGLSAHWRDFIPESRVDTALARSFMGGGVLADGSTPVNEFHTSNSTNLGSQWEHDICGHGLFVAAQVAGFRTIPGQPLTSADSISHVVDGAAPGALVIPLKVFDQSCNETWDSRVIAAIDYVTGLVESGAVGPTVINLSLGGLAPNPLEETAIADAIAAGVIVVAAAGNEGEGGMLWPGAYPQVISAGAVAWTKRFLPGSPDHLNLGFWWTQDVGFDPDPHGANTPAEQSEALVTIFSSRAIPSSGQQLDILAPGNQIVGPFDNPTGSSIEFASGTSFSSPLTAGVAALMLEKNPSLRQAQVEVILKSTALPMAGVDHRDGVLSPGLGGLVTISWDDNCSGIPCDPVGAGLLQADAAIRAVPRPRK